MINAQEIFKKCSLSMRLYISTNLHIKEALLCVVHNSINEPQVKGIPSDSAALYTFLQNYKNKIQRSPHIKAHQKSILLPTNCQTVDSTSLDISLIRYLIQTFNGIKNANNDWKKPALNDKTLCAYVFRAADFRNQICHDNDVDKLDEATFEKKWNELKEILQGLKYLKSIDPLRTEVLEFDKLECVIFEEFIDHLRSYKKECLNEPYQDDYIQRRFCVDKKRNNIAIESVTNDESSESDVEDYDESDIVIESDLENVIKDNDCIMIYAEAGMGKSSTARRIRKEWCHENILKEFAVLFFDSKKINKRLKVQSHAAPLYFSELGDYLKKNGRTEDDLSIYSCVKTTIEKLIILIDGIDEFPIRELVTGSNLDELERKVKDNELITGTEMICAIYFGYLFPYSKVILLGRIGEFERLKKVKVKGDTAIFNRKTKDLELLKFDKANIKDLICLKICKHPNLQAICTSACQEVYDKIKNIKLCKNPTDLNSLIELYKRHPNKNIGKITRTKLIVATIFNRLTNHVKQKNNFTIKTFHEISKQNELSKYLSCIRTLGEVSFKSLLEDNITVRVEEEQDSNGIFYLKHENQISIERETLEELDLFYLRDLDYDYILEPHHTLNIEFLCACYLFSHPDKWDSILKLNKDRQLVIIKFIAGLHADDYFSKDFAKNVLNTPSYSLEQFLSWLYNVENVRRGLSDGGRGYGCWFGLIETQKLSPSFFLLHSISQEVGIPQTFTPTKTIVCYSDDSFEWYDMEYLKHNLLTKLSDKLNIESFSKKFPSFKFVIKGNITINNKYNFNRLDQCGTNNLITFKINTLYIDTPLDTPFCSNFNVNTLWIGRKCDSRTIDMILNALLPPFTTIPSSNIQPTLKFKRIYIVDISRFNLQQTEKLFELCFCRVVDSISLYRSTFFTDEQLAILEDVERNKHKLINIELHGIKSNDMFGWPNLGNRHVCLRNVKNITDNDLTEFKEHIPPGYSDNLTNYKIIDPWVPFVRKDNYSRDVDHSMCLNLFVVDFTKVSSEVFAKTFSMISSLSCFDDGFSIPALHWLRLSQIEDCRLHEMRIWDPRPENFEHFFKLKTNILQFICYDRSELKQLLNYIVNDKNIQFDKQIKVFVVKVDLDDLDFYEEITLFSGKTIKEYKDDYSSDYLLLDNISVPFHEGEQHLKRWCCEISLPFYEKAEQCVTNTYTHSESSIEETKDESSIKEIENELSAIQIIGDVVYFKVVKKHSFHEQNYDRTSENKI